MSTSAISLSETVAPPDILPVTRADCGQFSGLTAAALRWILDAEDAASAQNGFCRLGAWSNGRPAGLLLSCPAADRQELTSIMVAPSMRGRGIGAALLADFSRQMREAGKTAIFARWSSQLPRSAEFSRMLSSAGWSTPSVTRRRMTWRAGDWRLGFANRDSVLQRLQSRGLVVRSLAELGADGVSDFLDQSRALLAAGKAPRWSNPEGWVGMADHRLTVVLLDDAGRVQGWMVCAFQPQFGRWYVPQGWVVADKISRGWLLGGIASLSQRLEEAAGPDALIIAQPAADIPGGMEQMLFKHFGNHTIAMDFLFESEQLLGDV
ncbi:GNAT family N-acetyltransferase [Rhizobium sp. RU36D]|uniref:GNAT family N-acetyltransferase n=1 Tax=Rhizobium sp. RU36D TaxID=1907415 RepID=UPI0009D88C4F|nr:GNAT family N-acetyltransferase [Rhizobium sp. RU36D]SMD17862.1 Acetyltransferase (GNAT) family protein [Rhizobium sp. RU36D]